MYLQELKRNWNTFGEEDPMWAVSSSPLKRGNKWDPKEFFSIGSSHMKVLGEWMDKHGYPKKRGAALDFGCGVGRYTQALCEYFDLSVGVDIAPSMIAKAKEYNQHGKNCVYRVNDSADLSIFRDETFDLVHTKHVLQHIRPHVSQRYVAEFVRILKQGGLAVFHCPSTKSQFAYPESGVECRLESLCDSVAMETRSRTGVPVRITNTCDHPIGVSDTINSPVRILHHWLDKATGQVQMRHGYQNVPKLMLEPGESFEFDYDAPAPPKAGDYMLVLEPATYLGQSLAKSEGDLIMVNANVSPNPEAEVGANEGVAAERPRSEMHCLPVDAVKQIVKMAGGKVLEAESSQIRPGALVSSTYYVTK